MTSYNYNVYNYVLITSGTPYDIISGDHTHRFPPGQKFNAFQQLVYLYTNYPDTRVPLSLTIDLLSEIEPTSQCTVSRLDYLPLAEERGMVLWATGPDLRTLGNHCNT